jgi:hypothetical protein
MGLARVLLYHPTAAPTLERGYFYFFLGSFSRSQNAWIFNEKSRAISVLNLYIHKQLNALALQQLDYRWYNKGALVNMDEKWSWLRERERIISWLLYTWIAVFGIVYGSARGCKQTTHQINLTPKQTLSQPRKAFAPARLLLLLGHRHAGLSSLIHRIWQLGEDIFNSCTYSLTKNVLCLKKQNN